MARNSDKKLEILALLKQGETDYEVIASKVGCSVAWVKEVARNSKQGSEGFLPATLEGDLALVDELAGDFDGKDHFAAGVRWLGKSLMFSCRLLGQLSAVPTMGRVGELTELITLARAMEHKPAPTDPQLMQSLNNVSQSISKMAAPKTPEMAMFEMMQPILQGVIGSVMGMALPQQPGQQPGQTGIPGFVDTRGQPGQAPGVTNYRRDADGGYSKSSDDVNWQKVVDETELENVKQMYSERG